MAIQDIRLRNLVHEEVVCRLFPYYFEGHDLTWYFSLESCTINSWDNFQKMFLKKFGDDTIPTYLVMDLSSLKIKGT